MHNIKDNLDDIHNIIAKNCAILGRNSNDITLIAVSKGQDFAAIALAYEAGIRHFGENYAQEMSKKIDMAKTKNLSITWHFLGAIQSNKIKLINKADFIHTISSIKQAQLIDGINLAKKSIFIEVNLANDPQRHGCPLEHVLNLALSIKDYPHIHLAGLMCIAPNDQSPSHWFNIMARLRHELSLHGLVNMKLSMGMSADFSLALAQGSDYVRIGTKIFGPRLHRA